MKVKLDADAFIPERAHPTDAGLDIRCPIDVMIPANGSAIIPSGVHVQLPANTVGMVKSKSGLNIKHDIVSEGVVDEEYTGQIIVKLYNHGRRDYFMKRGDKMTQLVVMPCMYVDVEETDTLEATERGENGFGSTGR